MVMLLSVFLLSVFSLFFALQTHLIAPGQRREFCNTLSKSQSRVLWAHAPFCLFAERVTKLSPLTRYREVCLERKEQGAVHDSGKPMKHHHMQTSPHANTTTCKHHHMQTSPKAS